MLTQGGTERNGVLVTPPVECGLLAGVYRQYLLEQGRIRESIITVEELKNAGRFYLINSVRRRVEVKIK